MRNVALLVAAGALVAAACVSRVWGCMSAMLMIRPRSSRNATESGM